MKKPASIKRRANNVVRVDFQALSSLRDLHSEPIEKLDIWTCQCGCSLFYITQSAVICAGCDGVISTLEDGSAS